MDNYSAFLRATFFVFAGAAGASAVFFEAVRFNLALIDFLFLALPKEPIVLFPFAVFLSPLPIGLL